MYIEKKKESILFIAITFLTAWMCWGILILKGSAGTESTSSTILYAIGGISPAISALIIPLFANKGARCAYYRRYFKFSVPLRWYAFSIVSVLLAFLISYGVMNVVNNDAAKTMEIKPLYMIFPFFVYMVIGGGLEEIGWRGVLVHNLRKNNPFLISLGVGMLWALWHVPLFFIEGTDQYKANFIPFIIFVLSGSLTTTLIYLKSGSTIPCIIQHALTNTFLNIGFHYGKDQSGLLMKFNMLLFLISLIIFIIVIKVHPIKKSSTMEGEADEEEMFRYCR
jgi:membrane protease YdiL (CAAX protease family)